MERNNVHLLLYIFGIICLHLQLVAALECYKCSFSHFHKENTVTSLLRTYANSEDICKLENQSDLSSITKRTCPDPKHGDVAKCYTVTGNITTTVSITFGTTDIDMYTVTRGCIDIPIIHTTALEGCQYNISLYTYLLEQAIKNQYTALASTSFSNTQLDGEMCYSSNSLSNGPTDETTMSDGGSLESNTTSGSLGSKTTSMLAYFVMVATSIMFNNICDFV